LDDLRSILGDIHHTLFLRRRYLAVCQRLILENILTMIHIFTKELIIANSPKEAEVEIEVDVEFDCCHSERYIDIYGIIVNQSVPEFNLENGEDYLPYITDVEWNNLKQFILEN
jgi:hypothetical protein